MLHKKLLGEPFHLKKNIALQEAVEILKLVFIFVVVAFVCFGLDFGDKSPIAGLELILILPLSR